MWHLGAWCDGWLDSVRFLIGLNDLKSIFQPKWFCDFSSKGKTIFIILLLAEVFLLFSCSCSGIFWAEPLELQSPVPHSLSCQMIWRSEGSNTQLLLSASFLTPSGMGGVRRQWRKLHLHFDQYSVWCYPRQCSRCQCAKCYLCILGGHVFPKSLDLDEKKIAKYIYVVQELGKNFKEDKGYALSFACCLVFPGREGTSKLNAVKLHIFIDVSELVREQFFKSKGR